MISSVIQKEFERLFEHKSVLILGFGREGQSTLNAFFRYLPGKKIAVADKNKLSLEAWNMPEKSLVEVYTGENYLECIGEFDYVIKAPGISYSVLEGRISNEKILSQAGLFISVFKKQISGITGSKGKSTTSTLLFSILKEKFPESIFVGNIGIPPLDRADEVTPDTKIVYELSSHQLEHLNVSPHIAILLNVFQEHLDHYKSYHHYQAAKYNIGLWQEPDDFFIYNLDNDIVREWVEKHPSKSILLPISFNKRISEGVEKNDQSLVMRYSGKEYDLKILEDNRRIKGSHNLWNICAASLAAFIQGVDIQTIERVVGRFEGLPHRLQYIGKKDGVDYYNDSISTIPEAAIEALKTLPQTHTLILGGYDRGIDYDVLLAYLRQNKVPQLILMGEAGKRMFDLFSDGQGGLESTGLNFVQSLEEAVKLAIKITPSGSVCLLSPAAASYNEFKNFEERGQRYKELIGF